MFFLWLGGSSDQTVRDGSAGTSTATGSVHAAPPKKHTSEITEGNLIVFTVFMQQIKNIKINICTGKTAKKADRRSFVIQMEEEEHLLNMQILKRKLEFEDLRIAKMKKEIEIQDSEASKRMELLDAQIARSSLHEIVIAESS